MVVAAVDGAKARNQVARDYIEWGFGAFDPKVICRGDAPMGSALVQDGSGCTREAPRGGQVSSRTVPKWLNLK